MGVIGAYFAVHPKPYVNGLARLMPKPKRARARDVLGGTGSSLWHWLIGQLITMTIVGVLTTIGLLLLGMPLAFGLGFLAFALEFIPIVGAYIAAVPAILLALTQGPTTALYVALLYVVVQFIEGNITVPIVQKKETTLPPVITLVSVLVFGVLFGFFGVLLAAPLAVVAFVLVKMLYLEDALGDEEVKAPA